MKKKLLSLLLALCLVMALVPMTAFAEENEQSSKTSITTVDELLEFAKAVDNGEYDDKTDAVVSLDADLDLTGVAWTPIGSVFAADGTLLHYFSGKFYGNGHTISNLDFSENYGKTEYPSFGFFSEVYGAEISGLTIQGKLNVSNSGYVYFGTVAGVAADSKISDCASNVSFTDTDKYINGTVALCGYAINSTIEYCQNKGDFSITQDVTSFQMGGIVGLAQNSTVQYCANTGDLTSWTPCTGGIVGQLIQNSKVINCYSTGKIVPLGKGTTDFGGIAGTVGTGTEIRHCYFAGEVDLSQYTATTPYKRLGGIVGGVSSDTPVFENNYFIETENVTACSKYTEAGTAKSLEYMETEDFFNEITTAGGNYRFNSNGTPLLPAPKYAVSFVVTPAELANVVIKVNGQEVANPVDLETGTYTVEVSADNCEVFNLNITINLVIYGHHIKGGKMFGALEDYKSQSFYEEHKTIQFDTLTQRGEYEIIAVFKTVAYSSQGFRYYDFVNADSEDEFNAYIQKCKELALYETGVTAEYGDRLITLSTCEYSAQNGRLVVVAKKTA